MTQKPTQVNMVPGTIAPQVRPLPMQVQPQNVQPVPIAPQQPQVMQPQPVSPVHNVPQPASLPPMPSQVTHPQSAVQAPPAAQPMLQQPFETPNMSYQATPADLEKEGGEKALPNISIQAFCERSETANIIHEMSRDWRMKRTNLKIFMGGLPASVEYYHKEGTPDLILVESGMRGEELFAQLEQLASVCDEGTQLIMIGAANDIKLYRQLMEKGVGDYIVPPFHPLSFIRSISELYVDPEKPFTGRVAAFFGAKGGVGSSTLAHNVAWCLSEQIQQATALIDLDASWGTTGLDFAYDATEGLEEALSQPDRLDENLLDRIMLRHTPNLSILPASGTLGSRPVMSSEAYETVVNEVRAISPLTILDMPHFWSDWTSNVLTGADDIVITAVPNLANLRNTKNLIDFLKAERPNDAEPILVLNKVGTTKNAEISVKDFGAAVGLEPSLVIGYDPEAFTEAANDGKMLTEIKTASETVAGLNYIAQRLKTGKFPAPIAGKSKGGRSMLSRKKDGKTDKKASGEKSSLFSMLGRK